MARVLASLLIVALVGFATPPARAAGDPAVQQPIEALYDSLLEVMKAGKSMSFADRVKKLDPVVRRAIDLPYMAQFVVGRRWKDLTQEQKDRFVDAFSRNAVATYANRFSGYGGEKFVILDQLPGDGGKVRLRTRLEIPDKEPVTLDYLMHQTAPGEWRAADVYYGPASQLATSRSDYSSTLQGKGIDGLIAALEMKTRQLGGS
jgi:phospholipid transport system substrate-binding protein